MLHILFFREFATSNYLQEDLVTLFIFRFHISTYWNWLQYALNVSIIDKITLAGIRNRWKIDIIVRCCKRTATSPATMENQPVVFAGLIIYLSRIPGLSKSFMLWLLGIMQNKICLLLLDKIFRSINETALLRFLRNRSYILW